MHCYHGVRRDRGCPTLSPGVGEGWERLSVVPGGLGFLTPLPTVETVGYHLPRPGRWPAPMHAWMWRESADAPPLSAAFADRVGRTAQMYGSRPTLGASARQSRVRDGNKIAQHGAPSFGAECWVGRFYESRAGFSRRHKNPCRRSAAQNLYSTLYPGLPPWATFVPPCGLAFCGPRGTRPFSYSCPRFRPWAIIFRARGAGPADVCMDEA